MTTAQVTLTEAQVQPTLYRRGGAFEIEAKTLRTTRQGAR